MAEFLHQHGRLSYRKKSTGAERGRELWSLTHNRDGSRTMRCLAMTDDSKFVRDVTYTIDGGQQPLECYIRLQVAGRWIGSGYFRNQGGALSVITDRAERGHNGETIAMPPRFHITTHAVMLDGWPFWNYDARHGGKQALPVYNTSTQWNGVDGPYGKPETLRVWFLGEEKTTVPAGTFACRRYQFDSEFIKSPISDVWVTGEDSVLVRYDWGGLDLEYVLTEWSGRA